MKNFIEHLDNQFVNEHRQINQNNIYSNRKEYFNEKVHDKNNQAFNLKDLIHPFDRNKEDNKNSLDNDGKEESILGKMMPQIISVHHPNSNFNTLTLQDKENFQSKEDGNKYEVLNLKEDQVKETLQASNNLEFLSTLIRLKNSSDNLIPQITVNTFFNNDESRIQVKELIDLVNQDKKQINIRNEVSSNNPYEAESYSFIHNKSNSNNAIKLIVPNVPVIPNTDQNTNNKVPQTIPKKPFVSSVNGYFNRRHTEVISRVEKMRKEKMMKEQAELKKKPEINKRSRMIAERLSSKHFVKSQNQPIDNMVSPKNLVKSTDFTKENLKSYEINSNNNNVIPVSNDINSIIELSIAEFKNNRKENSNFDMNLILSNLDSQKKNSFTKRTKSSEHNLLSSLRNEDKDHFNSNYKEDQEIYSVDNKINKVELEHIEKEKKLIQEEKHVKPVLHDNPIVEVDNIIHIQSQKKRYYFKEFNNSEQNNSKEKNKNKLVDGLNGHPSNIANLEKTTHTNNVYLKQGDVLKSPPSIDSNRDKFLDEMIKNHCTQNKKEKIPKAMQIEDLMNSIAQYNQYAIQNSNINNAANKCNKVSPCEIKSNCDLDFLGANKHNNGLNNSYTSGNSKGKHTNLLNSSKKMENNVVYVDLRDVGNNGNNKNNYNSKLLSSITRRECISTNRKPFSSKITEQTNRDSARKNVLKEELMKKNSSKRNNSNSINLKKNYKSAAFISQSKKNNMTLSEVITSKKSETKLCVKRKLEVKTNFIKSNYQEDLSKKKKTEYNTKSEIFQARNLYKKGY